MSWSLALVIIVVTCVLAGAIEGIVETITRAKTKNKNEKYSIQVESISNQKNRVATTENDLLDQLEEYIEVGFMWNDLINKKDLLEWIKEKRKKV